MRDIPADILAVYVARVLADAHATEAPARSPSARPAALSSWIAPQLAIFEPRCGASGSGERCVEITPHVVEVFAPDAEANQTRRNVLLAGVCAPALH